MTNLSFLFSNVKRRDSNIELLRIVSMFLVLVAHACYTSLGAPSQEEVITNYGSSFLRGACESFSEICVNVFVLISGWYGIRVKAIRFVGLIFQVLFISIILYVLLLSIGFTETMNTSKWIELLLFKCGTYWFIRSYIILYIFAPILNTFTDYCTKYQLKRFLVAFYVLQTVYGFYNSGGWFSSGYSPLSFMGLYLLARYIRLYPNKYIKFHPRTDFALYIMFSLFTVFCSLSLTYLFGKGGTILFQYSSPLVIISSLYFFLFFTKFSFSSRFINCVSSSCFAVYIFHCSPFLFHSYYTEVIHNWFEQETTFPFFVNTTMLILIYFTLAVFFDKVRLLFWEGICRILKIND